MTTWNVIETHCSQHCGFRGCISYNLLLGSLCQWFRDMFVDVLDEPISNTCCLTEPISNNFPKKSRAHLEIMQQKNKYNDVNLRFSQPGVKLYWKMRFQKTTANCVANNPYTNTLAECIQPWQSHGFNDFMFSAVWCNLHALPITSYSARKPHLKLYISASDFKTGVS